MLFAAVAAAGLLAPASVAVVAAVKVRRSRDRRKAYADEYSRLAWEYLQVQPSGCSLVLADVEPWLRVRLPLERRVALIRAGLLDPGRALAPDVVALTDDDLATLAALRPAGAARSWAP